ncbi:MAG: metal ABC transporter ATP-binding protein [Acidimicrobiia bacterium]
MTAALALDGVGVAYGSTWALRDVDLTIEPGEFVGIVGPSGAGKTSLLRIVLGEIEPTKGTITRDGVAIGKRKRPAVGYVPQLDASERTFPLTVRGAVELGAAASSARVPWFSRAERAAAHHALGRLGIDHLASRGLHELSGGQFQRVLFARALVAEPTLLLLDEPTSGIDLQTRADMLGVVGELVAGGLTVVLTTHDLNWVAAHLPRVVCLNRSVQADGRPLEVLTPSVLKQTFDADMQVFEHDGRPVVVDSAALIGPA